MESLPTVNTLGPLFGSKIGKRIMEIELVDPLNWMNLGSGSSLSEDECAKAHNLIRIRFYDRSEIFLFDTARDCCAIHYFRTDDELSLFIGSVLTGGEVRPVTLREDEGGVHEISFLVLKTSNGDLTFSNHNEHNGYYGGIKITVYETHPYNFN